MLARLAAIAAVVAFFTAVPASAAVTPLTGPGDFLTATTVANFDAWPDGTIANSLYAPQGMTLSLPAGGNMPVYDWAAIFRVTTSSPNVLAAVGGPGFTFSTGIDANFSQPITEVGAYMGNDQGADDGGFLAYTVSVYDASNTLLGSQTVAANQNTSVDQFVGLRSTVPFVRARFENTNWVTANQGRSAILDDLTFTSVPEPVGLIALIVPAAMLRRRRC
jgi:hypothetical protein